MKRSTPRRLTGAALLLALLLSLGIPATAWAAEPLDIRQHPEAVVGAANDDASSLLDWLVDTWDRLHAVVLGEIRSGGSTDGGDRGSGVDPTGHDHQTRRR